MCQIQAVEEDRAAPTGCTKCVWLQETVAGVPASLVYIFIASSVVQITNCENQNQEVVVCAWLDTPPTLAPSLWHASSRRRNWNDITSLEN